MIKNVLLYLTILIFSNHMFSQKIEIPTKKSKLKVVALVDMHKFGQLVIRQQNKKKSFYATLINNEMEIEWETECKFIDDNGRRSANYFTFLHNDSSIFIINQSKNIYVSKVNIETGEYFKEKKLNKSLEMKNCEFFISKNKLYLANYIDNQIKIYLVNNKSLINQCKLLPTKLTEAVKNTALKIIKVSNDTILSYQSIPESNHNKLHIIFYKHKTDGHFIDTIYKTLEIKNHYGFAFNSENDWNCQYVVEYKNNIYMFGNLSSSFSSNYGTFLPSNDSRGFWWASFDKNLSYSSFYLYPFKSIFKKSEEIIIRKEKYWGVKADADSGFFINMNNIYNGIYIGNLSFYINTEGKLKWFTNTDNKDNFMRNSMINTRQYIKKSNMCVMNDDWNFYSTHHFGKLLYNNTYQSGYIKQLVLKANKFNEDTQKSELAYTIIHKNGFAILAEYYFKKNKVLTLEVIK